MKMRKVVAGSVLAAGLGVAGMLGASPAQALGLSVDANGDGQSFDIGSGATTTQSGQASNNPALAVSLLGPASTSAGGNATGNTLIAVDGQVHVSGHDEGNVILNVGSKTGPGGGNTVGQTVLTVCGTTFSGQGTIQVNPLSGGVC